MTYGANKILVSRYHDISCGHRVAHHEGACAGLHGHNYRITFYCRAPRLDYLGRVVDFSVLKTTLCKWLDENWDHKFLLWEQDPLRQFLQFEQASEVEGLEGVKQSICLVPFNPTAEQMACYLLQVVGPRVLSGTPVRVVKVVVQETRKCSAEAIDAREK
jgi:6-pyruvoyltetrahydropterin/6-carboxytetrahydropterin synthase